MSCRDLETAVLCCIGLGAVVLLAMWSQCQRQEANHSDASRLVRPACDPVSCSASQYEASWMVAPCRSVCRNALLPWPLPEAPCASLWPHLQKCSRGRIGLHPG